MGKRSCNIAKNCSEKNSVERGDYNQGIIPIFAPKRAVKKSWVGEFRHQHQTYNN